MSSHSRQNGNQLKPLGRELSRAEKLADRLERALALADREVGWNAEAPALQPAVMPSGAIAAPLQPAPAPTPGARPVVGPARRV